MGEIALALIRHRTRLKGIDTLRPNEVNRKFAKTAKATGIPIEELKVFLRLLIDEALDEAFAD